MKTVGIVCEYNPFHNGHAHQIELLRQNGFELVVCAMSGNFTQRGELAIADKYTRAESAVRCGADIVVELPFPFSSFSAEGFSRAGVHILSSLGVDTLSFGSESADLTLLSRAADAACYHFLFPPQSLRPCMGTVGNRKGDGSLRKTSGNGHF